VLVEKLPYLGLAIVAAAISVSVVIATIGLTSVSAYPLLARAAMALHSLAFYAWKTLLPVGLSPLYELPARVELGMAVAQDGGDGNGHRQPRAH